MTKIPQTHLQNHRVYNIGILDGQIQRHTTRRSERVAPDLAPGDPTQPVPVVHHNQSQQSRHTRPQRMAGKHHVVIRAVLEPQPLQSLAFFVEQPNRRLQQAMVHVPAIEHLHSELVVEQELVVALFD